MYCPYCGNHCSDSDSFCSSCGSDLSGLEEQASMGIPSGDSSKNNQKKRILFFAIAGSSLVLALCLVCFFIICRPGNREKEQSQIAIDNLKTDDNTEQGNNNSEDEMQSYPQIEELVQEPKWVLIKESETCPGDEEKREYEYKYDSNGKVTAKVGISNGIEYHYEYDNDDLLSKEVVIYSNGDEYSTVFLYDSQSNLLKKIERDYQGNDLFSYEYQYDTDGKLISEIDFEGCHTDYEYDTDGKLKKSIYYFGIGANDCIRETEYDSYGNMTHEFQYMIGSSDWNVETFYRNEYDEFGNLIRRDQINSEGEILSTTEYEYQDINLTTGTDEKNNDNFHETKMRLELSKVTMFTENNDVLYYTEFDYDSYGRKITETEYEPEGVVSSMTTFRYDEFGNMEEATHLSSEGKTIIIKQYEYNEAGVRIKEKVQNFSVNTTGSTNYYYDSSGRLLKEEKINAEGNVSNIVVYKYDESGNLIKKEFCGPDGTSVWEYEEYEYDPKGNEIKMYKYVSFEMVLGQYKESEYDSDGKIVKATLYNDDGSIAGILHYEYSLIPILEE